MENTNLLVGFRKDLILYPGPKDSNGEPTFNLYDPIRARYFKFSWEESLIYRLAKEGMTPQELVKEIKNYSPIHLEAEDIQYFFVQAGLLGLLNIPKSSEQIEKEREASKGSLLWWVIMHYLYIRIPLIHPDAFLERTLPYVKIFWTRLTVLIYLILTLIGIAAILNHLDQYLNTFSYFFSFRGFVAYALTISLVKVVHEFAHAYTAKNYKIEVPTMGIAIIVLWPVLYTDVTEAWKLSKRSQRLAISVAGIAAEAVIAGIATFGWAITSPGILNSIFFLISSITLVKSIFINFNPAMRFDGYYIFSDLWGIDNLRARSFAVGTWKLREWLFGFGLPCPEDNLSPKTIRGLWLYAFGSWIYLVILYTAIAFFVYYEFTKALGIILFFVEIAVFLMWPIIWEVQELYKLRKIFRLNFRLILTLVLSTLLCLWFVLPLPRRESVAAVILPQQQQTLYAPEDSNITRLYHQRGDEMHQKDPIVLLISPELEKEIQSTEYDIQYLQKVIESSSLDINRRSLLALKQAELEATENKLASLKVRQQNLLLSAEWTGLLYDWDETLKEKQAVQKNQVLGKVAPLNQIKVLAYVPEKLTATLKVGQKIEFFDFSSAQRFPGSIRFIYQARSKTLPYPTLASVFKGPLPVFLQKNQELELAASFYEVEILLDQEVPGLRFGGTGEVTFMSPPRSLLMDGLNYLGALFLRESGF